MQHAILASSAILAYVLLTQYGRRRFSWQRWLPAILAIPIAAAVYLSRAPAHRYDVYLYLVTAAAGCGFGALATAATGMERDPGTGQLYTREALTTEFGRQPRSGRQEPMRHLANPDVR
jgi:hypothetical protein